MEQTDAKEPLRRPSNEYRFPSLQQCLCHTGTSHHLCVLSLQYLGALSLFASWFLQDGANLSCFLLMEHRDEAAWPTWVQTLALGGLGTGLDTSHAICHDSISSLAWSLTDHVADDHRTNGSTAPTSWHTSAHMLVAFAGCIDSRSPSPKQSSHAQDASYIPRRYLLTV